MNYTGSNPPNNSKLEAVVIVPARYESVRLPGKALLEIAGKPMICWVVERALAAGNVSRAIVATDDKRILDAVRSAGYEAVMTSAHHKSGTDRIAEVAASLKNSDIVVNVQGDEPLIATETIERAVEEIGTAKSREQRTKGTEVSAKGRDESDGRGEAQHEKQGDGEIGIVTTWETMESVSDVLNPDVVKIVVDENEWAVYFSRSPVPYPRDGVRKHGSLEAALHNEPLLISSFRKHTGLYVYRREVLLNFAKWPQTELERTESLEQLRALEHGVKIRAIQASTSSIGVDTMEDLERVRKIVQSFQFGVSSSGFQVSSSEF